MKTKTIYWQALTPIHSGTGQTSASVIDLPIARETATNYPIIPASSIKGVLRDGRDDENARKIYGFTGKDKNQNAIGKAADLTFTDARVLCFPVRSYKGTFALLTCPLVLHRLTRDAKILELETFEVNVKVDDQEALTTSDTLEFNKQLILEDIDLTAKRDDTATRIANAIAETLFLSDEERGVFTERFAIVSNNVFTFFVETATEVSARIKLNPDTKTVDAERGALWYEEAIPAETIFSSFATSKNGDFSEITKQQHLQIGGKASVGRGLLRIVVKP